MTNVNHTLDPIRPDNGTVGDNMPSVDVEVVQVQEEIIGDDGIEDADKDAEVEEEMRKPNLQPDHIHRHGQKCTSMRLPTYLSGVGANIVYMGVERAPPM